MREIVRLIEFYKILILVSIFGSWIDPYRRNKIVNTVRMLTDPYLRLFKVIIPIGNARLDVSPIIAIWLLSFLQRIVVRVLF